MASNGTIGTPVTSTLFCTVEDIEALLQIEITEADQLASAQAAIAEVTEAIRNYCRQEISRATDDTVTLDCEGDVTTLLLPELPVVSVSAVVEDDETLVADDDYKLGQHGILHRVDAYWAEGVQIIELTYTHGYATLPRDLVDVATRAAARRFQSGLKAAEMQGVPGIQAMGLGDYSVTFLQEGNDSLLGASAARILLESEKDTLNRYRV